MSERKVTVVVSPLLALIKDQMDQLQVVVVRRYDLHIHTEDTANL